MMQQAAAPPSNFQKPAGHTGPGDGVSSFIPGQLASSMADMKLRSMPPIDGHQANGFPVRNSAPFSTGGVSVTSSVRPPLSYPPQQPGVRPQVGMPQQAGVQPQVGMPPQPGMPPQSRIEVPPHPQMGMPLQAGIQTSMGMPPQPQLGRPPQHGLPAQMGMPPRPQMEMPPQPNSGVSVPEGLYPQLGGQPPKSMPSAAPSQMGAQPQLGISSHPPMPPQMIGHSQSGMQPTQHGMPPQTGIPQQTMPPQPGMTQHMGIPSQPGISARPGMQPHMGMPPQTGAPQTSYMPGAAPQGYSGYTPRSTTGMMPQQNQRRLDPDQMPSPIQVMEDDRKTRSGVFATTMKGLVPPLVTTDFIVQDRGNASPRFIRSTMYSVPTQRDIMKQSAVPFSVVVSPFAELSEDEQQPPCVDMGELGPVRCVRCKAYMCPFMLFMDGGRRFTCVFCKAQTDVPQEYFQYLDHTGQRMDKWERPELSLGTYEFVATKDYCRDSVFPKPPAIIFVIDVSYNNVRNGLVSLLCQNLKDILQHLPKERGQEKSSIKVGFITYAKNVSFFNLKGALQQPQMMVVPDNDDMFMPLLDGFLCDVDESEAVLAALLQQLPEIVADTKETEIILGPAIQAGLEALKMIGCAGKLLVFHSSLPIAEAPGKLRNRDDRKLLATDKEKTVLTPQTKFYNNLGQDCVKVGASVELFLFPNQYIDVATVGQVARLTGGHIHKYTYFQADLDGERFLWDLTRIIRREQVFDAIMRVRTSTGVRPTDFFGHFFMSNTTDIELAAMDADKAVTIEIKHDDNLTEEDGVYVQAAILFTSCSGQRRLRILNLSLNTASQMADLYKSAELDTITNYLAKSSISKLMDDTPRAMKESLINRCATILACYRKNCATASSAGQLILPECMKLLPLYINSMLKSDALSGGSEIGTDDRAMSMFGVQTMDVMCSCVYFYPRLIPLHDLDVDSMEIPSMIRTSIEKLHDDGVYLLENGYYMFLWFGLGVPSDWLNAVFGVPTPAQVDIDRTSLPDLDNPMSRRVRDILNHVRLERRRYLRLTLVRQRDKLEMVFRHFLVEDKANDASHSYVDFLCHMHKEIRNLLS